MITITTNPFSKYGSKASWLECRKCGRSAIEAQRNCRHEINTSDGICILCKERLKYEDCEHPRTDEDEAGKVACEVCGEEVERR
jgi:hypothetical protein